MIEHLNPRKTILHSLLPAALATASLAFGQMPAAPPPPHYAWSDTTLSPDARADLVVKEMTLDEKISILHGQRAPFGPPSAAQAPSASNGGEAFRSPFPGSAFPRFRWPILPMV